jgi:hypothetical protein
VQARQLRHDLGHVVEVLHEPPDIDQDGEDLARLDLEIGRPDQDRDEDQDREDLDKGPVVGLGVGEPDPPAPHLLEMVADRLRLRLVDRLTSCSSWLFNPSLRRSETRPKMRLTMMTGMNSSATSPPMTRS